MAALDRPVGVVCANQENAMTKTAANPRVAESGRDSNTRRILSGITIHITAKARWVISAAVALITPWVLIAEGAAAPIADAMACVGNGSFMALAASANAFTMIP
jgi:hypothetical protein